MPQTGEINGGRLLTLDRLRVYINSFWAHHILCIWSIYFLALAATLALPLPLPHGALVWHLVLALLLTSAPLLYLGSISYAIYMYQSAIRYSTIHAQHGHFDADIPAWVEIIGILAIAFAAALSKHWIETPILALKDRFPLKA